MRILIISQHIHPMQSPRSYRTSELAMEFAKQGYETILYAVIGKNNKPALQHPKLKVKNINYMLFSTVNSYGQYRKSIIDRILTKGLKGLIEFPDIEFMFKVPLILKKETDIDLLITISMPHPINWGAALSKSIFKHGFPKVWISDSGDPYFGDTVNKKKFFYFKYIENFWLRKTDYITIPLQEGKNGYNSVYHEKFRIIPQGVDLLQFDINTQYTKNDVSTFAYAGSIYPQFRDPSNLLRYLANLEIDFKFVVYTKSKLFFNNFIKVLGEKLEIRDYIPRKELVSKLSQMDFILDISNPSTIQKPSKHIDYLIAGRPVIEITSEFDKDTQIKFQQFIDGNYSQQAYLGNLNDFDIKNVANKFIDLYNKKMSNGF